MAKKIIENTLKVSISKGNRKMGAIPSVSLPPVVTCHNCETCERTAKKMSRWTDNKKRFSRNGCNIWVTTPNIYKVTTDQGDFSYTTSGKLDYRKTLENFKKAGYTNVSIAFLGRDVTF